MQSLLVCFCRTPPHHAWRGGLLWPLDLTRLALADLFLHLPPGLSRTVFSRGTLGPLPASRAVQQVLRRHAVASTHCHVAGYSARAASQQPCMLPSEKKWKNITLQQSAGKPSSSSTLKLQTIPAPLSFSGWRHWLGHLCLCLCHLTLHLLFPIVKVRTPRTKWVDSAFQRPKPARACPRPYLGLGVRLDTRLPRLPRLPGLPGLCATLAHGHWTASARCASKMQAERWSPVWGTATDMNLRQYCADLPLFHCDLLCPLEPRFEPKVIHKQANALGAFCRMILTSCKKRRGGKARWCICICMCICMCACMCVWCACVRVRVST